MCVFVCGQRGGVSEWFDEQNSEVRPGDSLRSYRLVRRDRSGPQPLTEGILLR